MYTVPSTPALTTSSSTTCSRQIFAFWSVASPIASSKPRFDVGLPSMGTRILRNMNDPSLELSYARGFARRLRRSVRHEHWNRHRREQGARRPAQDLLAPARLAVAAHHDQAGTEVGGSRQEPIADSHVAFAKVVVIDAGGDAMEAQIGGEALARRLVGPP